MTRRRPRADPCHQTRKLQLVLEEHGFVNSDYSENLHKAKFPVLSFLVSAEDLVTESLRLSSTLDELGIAVRELCDEDVPQVQATYDPGSGIAVLLLMHATDAMLCEEGEE